MTGSRIPEKEIISPSPYMPSLLDLGEGVQDWFSFSSVGAVILETLDEHP